jgi:hypothetical protein
MQHGSPDHSGSERPIVFLLNCTDAVKYLRDDNEVLTALYDVIPLRVNLNLPDAFQTTHGARADMTTLLRERRDLSWQMAERGLEDRAWLGDQAEILISSRFQMELERLEHPGGTDAVKVVIVGVSLEKVHYDLMSILDELFANAVFFTMNVQGETRFPVKYDLTATQRFAEDGRTPLCTACGERMREAGSGWVCERDGNTYGLS